ncbi:MAG: EF hand [Candidatus Nitrotoga sp. SPKER]|nr:MAG: EF hand [Candidatus Nitrotoga sp. SPKER]
MKKTLVYFALTSCFVLGNTVAHANSGSTQENMHNKMYKDMDINSDGIVTKEEFNNYGEKKFIELDLNGDGQITNKEMKTSHQTMDGSGSVRNKMDDDGKDPKGMERSTDMSGDKDHQTVRHGENERTEGERTKSGSSNNSVVIDRQEIQEKIRPHREKF